MKKLLLTILIIVFGSNVSANLSFNLAGPVDVIEGDTLTIDIDSITGPPFMGYLDCGGANIIDPIPRATAGSQGAVIPVPDPDGCLYLLIGDEPGPIVILPGTAFTFMLITEVGDAGESYTLTLTDDSWTMTLDTLVVNVITAPDCMQAAGVDIDDPERYAAFIEAGSPECWCQPRHCYGDADNMMQGTCTKCGTPYAVGTADLNVMMAAWMVKETTFGPGIANVPDVPDYSIPSIYTPAACANFDNYDAGGRQGLAKTGYYHVGTNDLNILMANWMVREPTYGPGIPADCFPGNR